MDERENATNPNEAEAMEVRRRCIRWLEAYSNEDASKKLSDVVRDAFMAGWVSHKRYIAEGSEQ